MDGHVIYRVLRPQVIFENVDGEMILVHLEHGCYFSLDDVGAQIWELIEAGHTRSQIVETLRFRYQGPPDHIQAGVRAFIDRLLEEDLIAAEPAGAPAPSAAEAAAEALPAFQPPVLEKYTDMRDMLALDPVHDVEAAGWPVPKVDEPSWPTPEDASGGS